jgi:hypothetical protein
MVTDHQSWCNWSDAMIMMNWRIPRKIDEPFVTRSCVCTEAMIIEERQLLSLFNFFLLKAVHRKHTRLIEMESLRCWRRGEGGRWWLGAQWHNASVGCAGSGGRSLNQIRVRVFGWRQLWDPVTLPPIEGWGAGPPPRPLVSSRRQTGLEEAVLWAFEQRQKRPGAAPDGWGRWRATWEPMRWVPHECNPY